MKSLHTTAAGLLAVALALTPVGAQEDDPLIGDRPDFTESAITIRPGRVQVEGGVTHADGGDVESQEVGELLVRIGLTPRLELRVGLPSYARVDGPGTGDPDGVTDASLGVKLALGEAGGWTTALLAGTSLPTGSSEFGGSRLEPDVVLAAERDLTPSISLGTNLGLASGYDDATERRFTEVLASAALGLPLGESTGAFVEVFGIVPSSAGGPETWFFDAGVTRALGPDLRLDVRAGAGLNSAADDYFVGAGVIWRR